jgi:hypothetical protein
LLQAHILVIKSSPSPPFHSDLVQQVKFIWVVIHTRHQTQKPWFLNTKPQDRMFGDRSLIEWWSRNGSMPMGFIYLVRVFGHQPLFRHWPPYPSKFTFLNKAFQQPYLI